MTKLIALYVGMQYLSKVNEKKALLSMEESISPVFLFFFTIVSGLFLNKIPNAFLIKSPKANTSCFMQSKYLSSDRFFLNNY